MISLSRHTILCVGFLVFREKNNHKHIDVFFATQYCVFLAISGKFVVKCKKKMGVMTYEEQAGIFTFA